MQSLSFILLQTDLPEHLTPRTTEHSLFILGLFAGCILLTAMARVRQRMVFLYLFQAVFLLKPLEDLSREEYKQGSGTFFLFILQFFLITAGAVYWEFFFHAPIGNWLQLLVLVFVPSIYFIYQFLMTNLAAQLSGNRTSVQELNYFTLLLTQFFGLVFLFEFFVSYFQPGFVVESAWLMGITYVVYLIIRFLRGFWISLKQGIPWYYIILYFWTLEILPLLIVAKLLYYEEFQTWIS